MHWASTQNETIDLGEGASLRHFPALLSSTDAAALHLTLKTTVPFEQRDVTVFGKTWPQPRLVAWYGIEGYRYSGLTLTPSPWTDALHAVRNALEDLLACTLNSALINLYRNGRDRVGSHADNEPCFVPNAPIASLSLGATRKFVLARVCTREKRAFQLSSGSLLVMAGTTQVHWRHHVPPTSPNVGERINLTFRHMRSSLFPNAPRSGGA